MPDKNIILQYNIFNMNDNVFKILIFTFLLIIFGIVTFNAYMFISTKNNITIGAGLGLQFPYNKKQ